MEAISWSDEDRYFGPFTYALDAHKGFAVYLGSGDGDEYPCCRLRLSIAGRTLIVALPPIIKPYREKVYPSIAWDEATVARLGRNWYWSVDGREYGFSIHEGYLNVRYGRQTHSSDTEQSRGWFVPWQAWRHVRRSFYGLSGELVDTIVSLPTARLSIEDRRSLWEREAATADRCPTIAFPFRDFDGEELTAITRIEEREWRLGEGRWKWLSLFRRPKISRSLDIRFSGETGRRKGSWKGGTIGHSIEMLADELHEAAFRRYCDQHDMTFG